MRLNARTQEYLRDLKKEDPNYYQDSLRSLVDEVNGLTPKQAITASDEVFQDARTGELVSPMQLVKSMSGVEVDSVSGGIAGYRNSATPLQVARGVYKGDIGVNTAANTVGVPYMRVKDVKQWAGDKAAQAFFDPGSVDINKFPALLRAAEMGEAASTGDGAAMIAANKRYDIPDEYIDEFLKLAKIGNDGFGSSIRKSGLDEGRADQVIDPSTRQRVVELSNEGEKEFYRKRIEDLTRVWLQGGGRGLNDLRDDVSIPGNSYQMEHNYPYSKSNINGMAEIMPNRVGFLERHTNSEKGDMNPQEYYQQGRLAMLANQQGINISGVNKGPDSFTSLSNMMEKANPVTVTGDRRRKDYSIAEYPERALQNETLIKRAMEPQRRFASKPAVEEAARQTFGSDRNESPGTNRDRALFIEAGGDVTIGPGVLRSNGKNGNGNGH